MTPAKKLSLPFIFPAVCPENYPAKGEFPIAQQNSTKFESEASPSYGNRNLKIKLAGHLPKQLTEKVSFALAQP